MISADVTCKAEFYDLDPMQVVWHGNYARFLEQARSALMDKIAYGYKEMHDSGFVWPIVDMKLKYIQPIRLAQKINICATLLEYENRLKIDYKITDCESGQTLTKATTTQLAVATGELAFQSPSTLIDKVRDRL